MGKVILDMSMSLDGFMSGPNGEDWGLHDYFFAPSPASKALLDESFRNAGAIIMGRNTYDSGADQDGFGENPYGVTNFVLTHRVPEKKPDDVDWIVFVDGIENLMQQAQAAAGDRNILIGGGANIARQLLEAGLVDEIHIQLIHALFGRGARLFDQLRIERTALETIGAVEGDGVTHLRFRVMRQQ